MSTFASNVKNVSFVVIGAHHICTVIFEKLHYGWTIIEAGNPECVYAIGVDVVNVSSRMREDGFNEFASVEV